MVLGVTVTGTVVLEMAVVIDLVMAVTRLLSKSEAMAGPAASSSPSF